MSGAVNGDPQAFFVQGSNLVKSTRQVGTTWTAPTMVSISGVTIDASFVFGQATNTIPRRAFASRVGQIFEAVEDNEAWTFTQVSLPGTLQPMHASLSRDGLAVVFVDRDINNLLRLFLAKRSAVTAAFSTPIALPDQPGNVSAGNEAFPSFSHDCGHIFVSLDQTVVDVF